MRKSPTMVFTIVLVLDTQPVRAGGDEGVAAFKARNFQGAVTEFQEWSSRPPTAGGAYAQALMKKGRASRDKTSKRQVYLRASELAAELVAKDVRTDDLILKISAELGAGDYGKAVETGKLVTEKSSASWLAHLYLGQAYTSNGQFQEAIAPLEAAKDLTAKPAERKMVWRQLGSAYEKQKKYALSIDAYQNAGDQGGVARVKENQATDSHNKAVEQENAIIEQMKKEAEALEAELKALEAGGGD